MLQRIFEEVKEGFTFTAQIINGNWEVELVNGTREFKAFSPVDPFKALERLFDLKDEISG
jgi:hypothetical protein